jgi:hypothetical protein
MSKALSRRIRELEKKTGRSSQQVHAIPWRCGEESEEEAEDRYLSLNPGVEVGPEDLCVLIKKYSASDILEV